MSENELTEAQKQEIAGASKNATRKDPAADVRQWLQNVHVATLGTLLAKPGLEGFPTNSVVPFALDAQGRPFVLIAQIASHTQNLKKDNRCCLFIREGRGEGDPQAQWRATLIGRMTQLVTSGENEAGYQSLISPTEFEELKARYRERVPATDSYFGTHDFDFWRLNDIEKVRYIAGFGRICWFEGRQLLAASESDALKDVAEGAIAHMNEDHLDALDAICQALHGIKANELRMTNLDSRGFMCEQNGHPKLIYTSFGEEVSANGLRHAMVKLTKRARAVQH